MRAECDFVMFAPARMAHTRMATKAVRIIEGDGERLEDQIGGLYMVAYEGLFRYAVTIVPDRELAEDAVQECFLRYLIVRKEGLSIANSKAWLYRVLRNRLFDYQRRAAATKDTSIEAAVQYPDQLQDLEAGLQRAELSKNLSMSLTGRELECMRLRLDGLRYDEIAAVLRIRRGTVGAMLARALKKVRKVSQVKGTLDA